MYQFYRGSLFDPWPSALDMSSISARQSPPRPGTIFNQACGLFSIIYQMRVSKDIRQTPYRLAIIIQRGTRLGKSVACYKSTP